MPQIMYIDLEWDCHEIKTRIKNDYLNWAEAQTTEELFRSSPSLQYDNTQTLTFANISDYDSIRLYTL